MSNTLANEQDLVRRLVQGDEEAFCTLYAAYKKRLVYYAMQFIKSPEFAEDIFQDVFTAIWHGRKCIDCTQSFKSYLYAMIKNRILNLIRDIDHEQQLKAYIMDHATTASNQTEETVHCNELENLLEKGRELLTPRQREVLEMSRDRNMTSEEISERLGISVKTVNNSISEALKTLRTYLEQTLRHSQGIDLLLILLLLNC